MNTGQVPRFYDPNLVEEKYIPRFELINQEAQTYTLAEPNPKYGKTVVLFVDNQIGFHFDIFAVDGAIEDAKRLIPWFGKNMGGVDDVVLTGDFHEDPEKNPHIFNKEWWWDTLENSHPAYYTHIAPELVASGRYEAIKRSQREHSNRYVNHTDLYIWPPHCVVGTDGVRILPALEELIILFQKVTGKSVMMVEKGQALESECYSPFEAVMRIEGNPDTYFKWEEVKYLLSFDTLVATGQALSHCLLEAILSLKYAIDQGQAPDGTPMPKDMSGIYLLVDTSSMIQISDEFVAGIWETLQDLEENYGLNLVTTDNFSLVA